MCCAPEAKQSLVLWMDIYTHTHNTHTRTMLQIIGPRSLLAALVKYSASNFGTKSPADFAHPCYFQPRAMVLAGCLPRSGEPGGAQLSRGRRREAEPPLSPTCPTGLWWGSEQVMEKRDLPAVFTQKGADQEEPRKTLLHPVMTNEKCFPLPSVPPSGRRGTSWEDRIQKSLR